MRYAILGRLFLLLSVAYYCTSYEIPAHDTIRRQLSLTTLRSWCNVNNMLIRDIVLKTNMVKFNELAIFIEEVCVLGTLLNLF